MPDLAPLPVDNPKLVPISRPQPSVNRPKTSIAQSAAFLPLYYAALLYMGGIVLAHFVYLRPSWLLTGLIPLAAVALLAIRTTPAIQWLPIACIWITLGAWSAETEPAPALDPTIAQMSDGLLRTVEATVTDAGPPRPR